MSDTLAVQVGHKGRIVVPASIRARHQWQEGSTLVAVDTDSGVFLADRGALESILRARLAGVDLVSELMSDRRREARGDSTETTA